MPENVTRWLERLGLGQYADAFEENAIGWSVLPKLDHALLKEMGITAIGHRIQILEAATVLDSERPPSQLQPDQPVVGGDAERRQLTVMFCDLVGSTDLSQRLDPEDLREVIRAYQDACKVAIEQYDGYVSRYMGDGVLAYFGYPHAHEDDPERAVHAGLGLVTAMEVLNKTMGHKHAIELGVRVGIATGRVVVGDLIGEGASEESAVVGETPNLAARLQSLASSNTVVVGPGTHELAAGRFDYEFLGAHQLKGLAEPVRAWRVVSAAMAESRFEAQHRTGLTPLVGREHEIGLLLNRWEQAKEGDGQVVLISGEPGIGKSRIVESMRERTASEDFIRLRYQCSSYRTSSALHPVIEQLERAAQLESQDSPRVRLQKLESLLSHATQRVDAVAPLFASLLSIPTEGRYAPLDMTPERQKEATLEALVAQMMGLSSKQPVVLVFEDAHWADPTSLELLELIVGRAQSVPVLVVITFRPDFSPPWMANSHVTSLTLNRFSRSLATTLVSKVARGKPLPEEVRDQIIEKTDGVPLFVEELTKTVLESGLLKEKDGSYALTAPLQSLAIPATLHDSLLARLDRLGLAKEVAQFASAIGREFNFDLLAAILGMENKKLGKALDQLVEAGLVLRHGAAVKARYVFKHALVQDAAYESQLKEKRRQLHRRIAEVFARQFPQRAEAEPEMLAHHLTESGLIELAIESWLKAGLRASERSATMEAISHFRKGLELLATLPMSPWQVEKELALQVSLGAVLTGTLGYTAPETKAAYLRAQELCRQAGETPELIYALYGVWNCLFVGGEFRKACDLGEECLTFAKRQQDSTPYLVAHDLLGLSYLVLGKFVAAQSHLQQVFELYEPKQHRSLVFRTGEDPGYESLAWQSMALWLLGYPEQALERSIEAVRWGNELRYAPCSAYVQFYATVINRWRRDSSAVRERAEALIAISAEEKLSFWEARGTLLRGVASIEEGDPEKGVAQMQEGLTRIRSVGANVLVPHWLALLAEGHQKAGQLAEGLRAIAEALQVAWQTDERLWEAELNRVNGELLLLSTRREAEAETYFEKAIDVARAQCAKSLELRAATSLARLWQSQGKHGKASQLLAPIYHWFTEGFDTPDLKEAKALLDKLA